VLNLEPDLVIIQAGINDLVAGVAANVENESIEATVSNLQQLARMATRQSIDVLILTVVRPRRPPIWRWPFWSDLMPNLIDRLNAHLSNLAGGNVHVLDADELLAGSARYLPEIYAADTLHWDRAAYDVLNGKLTQKLDELLNAVQ
jgi:lysophospholipase L1-like esterase